MMHIVITGSESVGKTMLAAQLAEHYRVLVVPEFVREYAAQKGARLDFGDHGPIAKGQMELEDRFTARAVKRGDTMLVHDTDLVSTVVYCLHYFGRCPAFIEEAAIERRARHYVLLDVDVPWVPDGVRDRGDRRAELHALFEDTLSRLGASFTSLHGDWTRRFDKSVALIDELRQADSPTS
jgi:NadR type nicotinamide-nucleotide adenylyltransferase